MAVCWEELVDVQGVAWHHPINLINNSCLLPGVELHVDERAE